MSTQSQSLPQGGLQRLRERVAVSMHNDELVSNLATEILSIDDGYETLNRYETNVYHEFLKDNEQLPLRVLLEAIGHFFRCGQELMKPIHDRNPNWRIISFSDESYKENIGCVSASTDILHRLGYSIPTDDGLSYPDDIMEPDQRAILPLVTDLFFARAELQAAVDDGKKTMSELQRKTGHSASERVRKSSADGVTEYRSLPVTPSYYNPSNDQKLASVPIISTNLADRFLDNICSKNVSLDRWTLDPVQNVPDKRRDSSREQSHEDQGTTSSDQTQGTTSTDTILNEVTADPEPDNEHICVKDKTNSCNDYGRKPQTDGNVSMNSIEMQIRDSPLIMLGSRHTKQSSVFGRRQDEETHDEDGLQMRKMSSVEEELGGDKCVTYGKGDAVVICDSHAGIRRESRDKKHNGDSDTNPQRQGSRQSHVGLVNEIEMHITDLPKIRVTPSFQGSLFNQPCKQEVEKINSKEVGETPEEIESHSRQTQEENVLHNDDTIAKCKCVTCGISEAIVSCEVCGDSRCQQCDVKWHGHSARKAHPRKGQSMSPNNIEIQIKSLPNIGSYPQFTTSPTIPGSYADREENDAFKKKQSDVSQQKRTNPSHEPETIDILENTKEKEPCVLCGNEDATVPCDECGDARCVQCDAKWHRHKKRNKHKRSQVPKSGSSSTPRKDLGQNHWDFEPETNTTNTPTNKQNHEGKDNLENIPLKDKCVTCAVKYASICCDVCGDGARCESCDIKWHGHSERKTHQRTSQPNFLNVITMQIKELPNIRANPSFQEPLFNQPGTQGNEAQELDICEEIQRPLRQNDEEDMLNYSDNISKSKCVTCGIREAIVNCDVCGDSRCQRCDVKWHGHSARKAHPRKGQSMPSNNIEIEIKSLPNIGSYPQFKESPTIPGSYLDREENNAFGKKQSDASQQKRTNPSHEPAIDKLENIKEKEPCVLCGIEDATVPCDECGDARCVQCDAKWHRHKKRNKHKRSQVPKSGSSSSSPIKDLGQNQQDIKPETKTTDVPTNKQIHKEKDNLENRPLKDQCVTCGQNDAVVKCDDCGDARCQSCDLKWHSRSERTRHRRKSEISLENNIQKQIKLFPEIRFESRPQQSHVEYCRTQGKVSEVKTKSEAKITEKKEPCVLCGVEDATVPCDDCGDARCIQCDVKWHRHKKRNKHKRNQAEVSIDNNSGGGSSSSPDRGTTDKSTVVQRNDQMKDVNSHKDPDVDMANNMPAPEHYRENWNNHVYPQPRRTEKTERHHRQLNGSNQMHEIKMKIGNLPMIRDVSRPQTSPTQSRQRRVNHMSKEKLAREKEPCILCGVEDASVPCDECGDARCVQCDAKWHRHKKRNMHKRNQVIVSTDINISSPRGDSESERDIDLQRNNQTINLMPNEKIRSEIEFSDPGLGEDIEECALCGMADGTFSCIECKDSRCGPCDEKWHRNEKRKMHQRKASEILEEKEKSVSSDTRLYSVGHTLNSDNENILKKIDSIQSKLDTMDRNHDQEEYDALEKEKTGLLEKRQMLMVRIEAIDTIENTTSSRQERMTSLPHGGLISRGLQQNVILQTRRLATDPVSEQSRHADRVLDDEVFTDDPNEHENASDQQKTIFQDDDQLLTHHAKMKGFTADDIHIAKAQCAQSGGNFLHWLEFNYKDFISRVRASATNDLRRLIPRVRIAEASIIRALVKHPGDVALATDTCVHKVEAQICEIHQLGVRKLTGKKLTMQEVAEYLFKCNGNVEMVMERMKRDGIKIDITERVWRYDEREIASVLMKKTDDSTQIQRRKRLIIAEYGLSWDVASRMLDQIEAKRIKKVMTGHEFERWILDTLNFASKFKVDLQ